MLARLAATIRGRQYPGASVDTLGAVPAVAGETVVLDENCSVRLLNFVTTL